MKTEATKLFELRESLGKTMSHNYSPTLRAKLVKVNKITCVLEVTKGEYNRDKDYAVGIKFKDSVNRTWWSMYY